MQVGDDVSHLCPFWDLEACMFATTPLPCDSQLPFVAVSAQNERKEPIAIDAKVISLADVVIIQCGALR